MKAVLSSFVSMLRSCFRTRASMHIEILALRHQLAVLQRRTNERVRLRTPDRLLGLCFRGSGRRGRSALVIVKPETVIAWQRKGFRFYWCWKSRGREVRETSLEPGNKRIERQPIKIWRPAQRRSLKSPHRRERDRAHVLTFWSEGFGGLDRI